MYSIDHLSDNDDEFIEFIEWERRPNVLRERPNHFDEMDNHSFFVRFRLQKETVLYILRFIE